MVTPWLRVHDLRIGPRFTVTMNKHVGCWYNCDSCNCTYSLNTECIHTCTNCRDLYHTNCIFHWINNWEILCSQCVWIFYFLLMPAKPRELWIQLYWWSYTRLHLLRTWNMTKQYFIVDWLLFADIDSRLRLHLFEGHPVFFYNIYIGFGCLSGATPCISTYTINCWVKSITPTKTN